MKRTIFLAVVLLLVLGALPAAAGNGAPNGPHFNLNLIGVPQDKTGDFDSGNRIFIPLEGMVDIMLQKGDYQVVDGNGTDGVARFQLPDPADADENGLLEYSVWIRPVAGKGQISFQSCFTEFETAQVWCYAGDLVQNLKKITPPKFTDVSRDLLQVCADVNTDPLVTDLELVPLFSDLGDEYFWHVDNEGMRNVQMRFYYYDQTTPVGGDCDRGAHPAH